MNCGLLYFSVCCVSDHLGWYHLVVVRLGKSVSVKMFHLKNFW